MITNIVLQSVDNPLLMEKDNDMMFIRYCDDIVLMHTDKCRLQSLISTYRESLESHHLYYHGFSHVDKKDIGESGYWGIKSKEPFLWGDDPSTTESARWIGFLGFEIKRNGDVRIRKKSVKAKQEKLYKSMKQICSDTDCPRRERHRRRFEKLSIGIPREGQKTTNILYSHLGITDNPYSRHQVNCLKRTKKRLIKKIGDIE